MNGYIVILLIINGFWVGVLTHANYPITIYNIAATLLYPFITPINIICNLIAEDWRAALNIEKENIKRFKEMFGN